eukprot:scaffold83416_cov43-Cyclotella_meneghiniana.AAC.1
MVLLELVVGSVPTPLHGGLTFSVDSQAFPLRVAGQRLPLPPCKGVKCNIPIYSGLLQSVPPE